MSFLYICCKGDILKECDDSNLIFEFVIFSELDLKRLSDTKYYRFFLHRNVFKISKYQETKFKKMCLDDIYSMSKKDFLIENNLHEWAI